jgi:cyclase
VELIALGPAHTSGDVVVHLPVERIMAVGDLLEEGALWTACADLAGWVRALERIADHRPRVLLPAHGGVQRGDSLLRGQLAFLRASPPDTTPAVDCRHAP